MPLPPHLWHTRMPLPSQDPQTEPCGIMPRRLRSRNASCSAQNLDPSSWDSRGGWSSAPLRSQGALARGRCCWVLCVEGERVRLACQACGAVCSVRVHSFIRFKARSGGSPAQAACPSATSAAAGAALCAPLAPAPALCMPAAASRSGKWLQSNFSLVVSKAF